MYKRQLLIFVILKFRKQFLVGTLLFIKAFDCFQDERVYNFFIIIPVQTCLLYTSMEVDSVPEELDEISRKIKQLEIEREAISTTRKLPATSSL